MTFLRLTIQLAVLTALLVFPASAEQFICRKGKAIILSEKRKITSAVYKKLLQHQLRISRMRKASTKVRVISRKIKALDAFDKHCRGTSSNAPSVATFTPTSIPTPTVVAPVGPSYDSCSHPGTYGAFADGTDHFATTEELTAKGLNAKYAVGTSWDLIGIQEAINNRSSTQKVCLSENGAYRLYAPGELAAIKIEMRTIFDGNNAKLEGSVIGNKGAQRIIIQAKPGIVPSESALSSFTLVNGKIALGGTSDARWAENITIQNINFVDGWTLLGSSNDTCNALATSTCPKVLELSRAKNVSVKHNIFTRSLGAPGSGISVWRTKNVLINKNSFVGAFVTAVNISSADGDLSEPMRNADIEVSDNLIRRTIGYYDYVEDHGIYAWGGIRMSFLRNDIAGWALSSSGGCMKIRNTTDTLIDSNHCKNSGIMLYTYSSTNPIPVLSDLLAINNTIDLTDTFTPPAQQASFRDLPAIMYWRNYEPNNTSIEKNIEITQNTIKNGSVSIRSNVDTNEFRVHNNTLQ